nr:MAG TPA: hypothetical protein [Caudoviricetes sp.]
MLKMHSFCTDLIALVLLKASKINGFNDCS